MLNSFKLLTIIILSKRLNSSIWLIDGTLTGTTNLDLGVMAVKGYSTFMNTPGLEHQYLIHFGDIPKTLAGRVLSLCRVAISICWKSDARTKYWPWNWIMNKYCWNLSTVYTVEIQHAQFMHLYNNYWLRLWYTDAIFDLVDCQQ